METFRITDVLSLRISPQKCLLRLLLSRGVTVRMLQLFSEAKQDYQRWTRQTTHLLITPCVNRVYIISPAAFNKNHLFLRPWLASFLKKSTMLWGTAQWRPTFLGGSLPSLLTWGWPLALFCGFPSSTCSPAQDSGTALRPFRSMRSPVRLLWSLSSAASLVLYGTMSINCRWQGKDLAGTALGRRREKEEVVQFTDRFQPERGRSPQRATQRPNHPGRCMQHIQRQSLGNRVLARKQGA